MQSFSLLVVSLLIINVVLNMWLNLRQIYSVQSHRNAVPDPFQAYINLEDHQKAADYTVTKLNFAQKWIIPEAILLLIWTLGGGLNFLDQTWQQAGFSPLWTGVVVILSFMLIHQLIDLPIDYYRTFVIEEKFGFNKTTIQLFFIDMLKGLLLSFAIGVPLIALILWLMAQMGEFWWLWVTGVLIGFQILMLWAYPTIIAPMFNTFQPLEDETLKNKINNLLDRNGFKGEGAFVMDGSKRSGHGNAYFTGFGQKKRIVFFDTLLKSLNPDEIEAVLAHEIGHFKHHHLIKRLVFAVFITTASFATLAWLMNQTWFYQGLGISNPSPYMALLLFSLIMPLFTFFLSPLFAALSRKHEFEADNFAVEQTSSQMLSQALVKLYQENASTLTPDALFSAFHDSHPPAPVRIAHLNAKKIN
jgi:STE24 endopeptidase